MKSIRTRKSRVQHQNKHQLELSNLLFWGLRGLVLILFVLTVLVGGYMWWISRFQSWQKLEPFRILILHESAGEINKLSSLHFMPDRQEVIEMPMPLDAVVEVPGGYGDYRLAAVGRLSQIERGNYDLYQQTIEELLAIRFSRLLVVKNNKKEESSARNYFKQVFIHDLLMPRKAADSKNVWFATRELHENSFKQINLDSVLIESDPSLDGTLTKKFEMLLLDDLLEKHLVVSSGELSSLTVVVENTVGVPGLATQWSRFVRHAGFDVVNVVDGAERLQQSELKFESDQVRNSVAGKILNKVFPGMNATLGDVSDYRCRVVLRLGLDKVE